MKNSIQYFLQRILGLQRYLYFFAMYKIRTLKLDKKENDFFLFLSLLTDGKGAVLDIGANLGIMTVHLAKKFPNTTIHSFEPMPENHQVLHKISAAFQLKNVNIHELALGEEKGIVKMVLPVVNQTVKQGLSHIKHESIQDWNDGKEVAVSIEKLDDVIDDMPIQGIKIDVENFEYFALKGAEKILSNQHPFIYAELWDNENRKRCIDFLTGLNYTVFVCVDKKLTPYNPNIHTTQNFIFTVQ
jgi:FkbM family methyltransferase